MPEPEWKDAEGNPIPLSTLIINEPYWAANAMRQWIERADKAESKLSSCEAARTEAIRLMNRYRKALRQAWLDDGCRESEVEEMLEALDG